MIATIANLLLKNLFGAFFDYFKERQQIEAHQKSGRDDYIIKVTEKRDAKIKEIKAIRTRIDTDPEYAASLRNKYTKH